MLHQILVMAIAAMTVGCSTVTKNLKLASADKPHTQLIIYRPYALPGAAVDLMVGVDNKYFATLRNDQFLKVTIDAGTYTFLSKADGSSAAELKLILLPDQTVCLRSAVNPAVMGVALVPLMSSMVNWFQLEQVPCPSADFFKTYTQTAQS